MSAAAVTRTMLIRSLGRERRPTRARRQDQESKLKAVMDPTHSSNQRPIVRFHTLDQPVHRGTGSPREDRNETEEPSPPALSQRERGRSGPARRRTGSDGHDDRSAGQAGGGRVEPGDGRAIALGAVRLAAAVDRRFLPRGPAASRPSAARRASVFNYRPATQPINPRLLAEKDREEIAREEAESRRAAIAVAASAADSDRPCRSDGGPSIVTATRTELKFD